MKTVLITGANRGIGLEFVRQYLESGHRVLATCRKPRNAAALNKLLARHKGLLAIHKMDVSDEVSIEAAARAAGEEITGLDILINNAGIGIWKSFEEQEMEELVEVFRANSAGPLLVAKSFLPLMCKGQRPLLANITSGYGSIKLRDEFGTAGSYSYNASKAALNMIGKMLAIEFKDQGIIVILQSPGWVKTDMGGQGADLTVEQSVSSMIEIFDRATMNDSGKFYDRTGAETPW